MDTIMITIDSVKERFYQQWDNNKELGPACSATLFQLVNQDEVDNIDLFCYYLFGRTMSSQNINEAWETVKPEVEKCIDNMRNNGIPEADEALKFYRSVVKEN
ncbi:MAG: hypothetical protein HXX08_10920 [Chloroflexi bacterium]|uniref:Uncharacterized protein n=1 Tax=Candidatus Chlorohelix allophototropha TaxID=3003348 RepID=A0A8T7M240_9CHLR|nr:hypothetical protein [Chloroflexota bacterium]WJW65750.1 hypothetical protein OZ401_001528 [Chloroflexota bacterium L227-S17]